MLDFKKYELN